MSKINISGIRKVFDLAAKLKNPINLSIGQPHLDVFDEVKQSAIDVIKEGGNKYTMTQGIPELREACRKHYKEAHGVEFPAYLITSGVSGGIFLTMMATLNPGDEVILPDPYFVLYREVIYLAGAQPVFLNTYPDFKLHAAELEKVITPKTKIIVLASPGNPTGAVYSDDQLKEVTELAKKNNILIISDEIYEHFVYDAPATTIAKYYDNVMVLNGFSKSHSMTGWRLGYAMGPEDVILAMTKLQQFTYVCAPSFAQVAGLTAFETDTAERKAHYKAKRDLVYDGLKDNFQITKPGGAFYIFPQVPWGDDMTFVEEVIENNCLVIPGSVFSEHKTHFRISYAATTETLEMGIELLNRLAKQGGPK